MSNSLFFVGRMLECALTTSSTRGTMKSHSGNSRVSTVNNAKKIQVENFPDSFFKDGESAT